MSFETSRLYDNFAKIVSGGAGFISNPARGLRSYLTGYMIDVYRLRSSTVHYVRHADRPDVGVADDCFALHHA
jgi:hypothetical protein